MYQENQQLDQDLSVRRGDAKVGDGGGWWGHLQAGTWWGQEGGIGCSLLWVLTSGPASTSSFLASSQKLSGIRRCIQRRFLLRPSAVPSLMPFSSGRFILLLCQE